MGHGVKTEPMPDDSGAIGVLWERLLAAMWQAANHPFVAESNTQKHSSFPSACSGITESYHEQSFTDR
jgi:hypothetical protein